VKAAVPIPTAARVAKSPQKPREKPARKAKTLQITTPAVATARRERRSLRTPNGKTATDKSRTKAEATQPMSVSVVKVQLDRRDEAKMTFRLT
jgi:hypothetical protein